VGLRDGLRWAVRQPRAWVAFGAWVLATSLTFGDRRPLWTGFAGMVTFGLAWMSVAAKFTQDHPDHEERGEARRAARQQEKVDELLARYEAERAARAARPGRHAERR
jgi:hypothetical protein